jgi:hypothetical protein
MTPTPTITPTPTVTPTPTPTPCAPITVTSGPSVSIARSGSTYYVRITWSKSTPGAANLQRGNAGGASGSYPNVHPAGTGSSHTVNFTVTATGTYRYILVMEDFCGQWQVSSEYTFTVSSSAPTVTPTPTS